MEEHNELRTLTIDDLVSKLLKAAKKLKYGADTPVLIIDDKALDLHAIEFNEFADYTSAEDSVPSGCVMLSRSRNSVDDDVPTDIITDAGTIKK